MQTDISILRYTKVYQTTTQYYGQGDTMSTTYKRSLITMILFGLLFFYIVISFAIIGPEDYLSTRLNRVINSIIIVIAMLGFGLAMLVTNKKSNIVDERDMLIQKKATSTGMILTIMLLFLVSIYLFVKNEDLGTVYVSWMWVIAYGTFSFSYFITSMSMIVLFNREE